jgi:hypothetical protein
MHEQETFIVTKKDIDEIVDHICEKALENVGKSSFNCGEKYGYLRGKRNGTIIGCITALIGAIIGNILHFLCYGN